MIEIISDSTACLEKDFIKKNKIHIVPMKYSFGNKEFKEGLPPFKKFYLTLKKAKELPKTSQPSINDFLSIYEKIIKEGNTAIVFTLSSKVSGTFESALKAREQCSKPESIFVPDFLLIGQLTKALIEEAIFLIKKKKTPKTIISSLLQIRDEKLEGFFLPDTLEYLHKGGRISKLSLMAGNILKIKPILSFSDGEIKCVSKIIGEKKTLETFFNKIPKDFEKLYYIRIGESENFSKLEKYLKENFSNKVLEYGEVGPTLGSHIGKGIGLVWRNI